MCSADVGDRRPVRGETQLRVGGQVSNNTADRRLRAWIAGRVAAPGPERESGGCYTAAAARATRSSAALGVAVTISAPTPIQLPIT